MTKAWCLKGSIGHEARICKNTTMLPLLFKICNTSNRGDLGTRLSMKEYVFLFVHFYGDTNWNSFKEILCSCARSSILITTYHLNNRLKASYSIKGTRETLATNDHQKAPNEVRYATHDFTFQESQLIYQLMSWIININR